jgi:hypothetical protein
MKLPLSALRRFNACDLDKRIADFTAHHGHPPDEESTFHEWAEVTSVINLLWAIRCLEDSKSVSGEFIALCDKRHPGVRYYSIADAPDGLVEVNPDMAYAICAANVAEAAIAISIGVGGSGDAADAERFQQMKDILSVTG